MAIGASFLIPISFLKLPIEDDINIYVNWEKEPRPSNFPPIRVYGNPLHCSCLENPRDGGAWWAAIYGVVQSRTRLKRLRSSSRVYVY